MKRGRRAREPQWLTRTVIDAIQAEQIREHGGLPGIRDEHALESALARSRQKWAYEKPDLAMPAAAYGFGIARSHPYRDGNRRIAFLAIATFLGINGFELNANDAEVVGRMLALAAGDLNEEALADWIRGHMVTAE